MQSVSKPEKLLRTTYRDMRSPPFDVVNGFKTEHSWLKSEVWRSELTGEVIEHHLERDFHFEGKGRMLISLHSSPDRAMNYARVQRERLVFDDTCEDPNVWVRIIAAESLKWHTVSLTGPNEGKRLRVLQGPDCCFFSTADAREAFGRINSRWTTDDEWFAIGQIPCSMVVGHIQLAFGQTNGDRGTPYKLRPVPQMAVPAPSDLVRIDGPIDYAVYDSVMGRREMTEEEEGLFRTEVTRLRPQPFNDGPIYRVLARGNQRRFGQMMTCVEQDRVAGIFVLVL